MPWVTCTACRLVQPPAPRCAACGEPEPSTWLGRPTKLFARDIGSGWLRRLGRARLRMTALPTTRLRGRFIVEGVARSAPDATGATAIESFVTGRRCLAATLRLVDDAGSLFIWYGRAATFDIETRSGTRLRVHGPLRIDGGGAHELPDADKRRWLGELEPARQLPGRLQELSIDPGDPVAVHGLAAIEAIADGYRTVREQPVVRPAPGAPVTLVLVRRAVV
jgi:hypothetical protein